MANSRSITVKVAEDGSIILDEELSMLKQMKGILQKSFHGYLDLLDKYGTHDAMVFNAGNEFYKYLNFANDTVSIINYTFEANYSDGKVTFKKI